VRLVLSLQTRRDLEVTQLRHDRVTVVAPVVRGARPLSFQVTQKLPQLVAAAAAQLPDVRVVSNTNQPPPGQAGQRNED
jgi:hypothetical protein